MYRDNVAYRSGGAVYAMGSQLSTLLITGVIFDTNIVQTPTDGAGVELTVRLNSKIELSRFAHPCTTSANPFSRPHFSGRVYHRRR